MPAIPERLLLLGAFAALYLIWGSTYLAIRIGVASWPPLLLAGVRFLLAGGILYAWLRWRGTQPPTAAQWRSACLLGSLLLVCGNGGVTVAESLGAASGVAALMVATVPLFTLLFGLLWGQRNSRLDWAAIILGLLGIGLLNSGASLQASPLAAVLLLLAPAGWALGSVWGRYLAVPAGVMASASQMLAGGAILLLGSLLSGERMQQWPDAAGWVALGYLTLFGSIIAYSAYLYLLKTVRPAAATSYAYVNPVVAVLLGVAFAEEHFGTTEALAMVVIVAAVLLTALPQWRFRPGTRGV
ncbi:MAG: drug/metabolite exporter YedA [Halieaceae bacterium]|jgi:drug/metabolite transporter (DMT)-like permease|nr:drug/metabolite exporter YedA [Halieaceae bacterium]